MNGLIKLTMSTGLILATLQAWGGTITVNGISNLKHQVEFVTMRLNITSRCFEDPELASTKNQEVMEQIKKVIEAHKERQRKVN